jgi:transcriptional regulator with XRE-family HTH domain
MKYNIARIQRERVLRGWTKAKLAEVIGKDPSTISLIENGDINGNPGTIKAIAEALGVPMEELLIEETA